jgi:hypothetical protein
MAPAGTLPAAAGTTDGTVRVLVLRDVNRDGESDSLDLPQAGIEITVTDAGGASVTGTTDGDGEFVLAPTAKLTGGRYFVVASVPADLDLSPVMESKTFQPFNSTVDVTSESQTVRLGVTAPPDPPAPSTAPPPPPPAVEPPAPPPNPPPAARFAVGDHVWRDQNRQGRQDAGEGAAGRTSVQLLDGTGTVLDSTTTDAAGRYLFDDLPAGVYSVRFAGIPSGSKLSPNGGGTAALDSDPDYTGATPPFRLEVGAANVRPATPADQVRAGYLNPTIDAGVALLRYAVASQVWQDLNRDGVQDPAEPGAPAVVDLLDARGNPVAQARTDNEGRFSFDDLAPGRYRLRFGGWGPHRQPTIAHAGGNPAADSDADPRSGLSPSFILNPSAADLVPASTVGGLAADFVQTTVGAGLIGSYAILNRVWRDRNGDGRLSDGESGIAGVRVELLDTTGTVVAVTRTGSDGRYAFTALPAGEYRLRFSRVPRGLYFSAPGAGADPTLDSDVYLDNLTVPIAVGEDHPVEGAVGGAGLTSSPTSAVTTRAPSAPSSSSASSATSAVADGVLGRSAAAAALPAVALGAGLLVGLLVLVSRLRRR